MEKLNEIIQTFYLFCKKDMMCKDRT